MEGKLEMDISTTYVLPTATEKMAKIGPFIVFLCVAVLCDNVHEYFETCDKWSLFSGSRSVYFWYFL